MILVIGECAVKEEAINEALHISLEHCARSLLEPGCLSHEVSRAARDPLRLIFVERWTDHAALMAHVQVPASRAFGKALGQLCASRPSMDVYDSALVPLR